MMDEGLRKGLGSMSPWNGTQQETGDSLLTCTTEGNRLWEWSYVPESSSTRQLPQKEKVGE